MLIAVLMAVAQRICMHSYQHQLSKREPVSLMNRRAAHSCAVSLSWGGKLN